MLWEDREPASPSRAVDGEISPIEREDLSYAFALGDTDERCVGKIHRQIAVFVHQRAETGDIFCPNREEL